MHISPNVLLFSWVDFSLTNGGAICTKVLIENMARYAEVKLTLVTTGHTSAEAPNHEFATKLGMNHRFIPLRERRASVDVSRALMDKYYYIYERAFEEQPHIDQMFERIVAELSPDLIVVNGIISARCIPRAFSSGVPCCFITHNLETDIHRDSRRYVPNAPADASIRERLIRTITRHCNAVSNYRFALYMRQLYRQCVGVIALAPYDIPSDIPKHLKRIVMPPLLSQPEKSWAHSGSRSLLFVGNSSYFANRFAIEWIRDQLAPELLLLDAGVSINIIGAGQEFATRKKYPNVNYLGVADRDEVARRMTSEDLLVVPTSQRYGAKLKLAESAAYGMPFIATSSAMGGLPFLEFMPKIQLNQPATAARIILRYLDDPKLLIALSQKMTENIAQARRRQALTWAPFIRSMLRELESG